MTGLGERLTRGVSRYTNGLRQVGGLKGGVLQAAVALVVLCGGCTIVGPSDSQRALQTQVAFQVTQLAELREQLQTPTPAAGVPQETATQVRSPTHTSSPTTVTEPVPSETAMGGGAGPVPQSCDMVAEGEVTVYQRPSADATVFGSMPAGSRVTVEGKTADGWLGFDPGVAQAANVGVFRLRWIHESGAIRLEGPCDGLAKLVGPPPGFCFTMSMDEVQVYAEPDISSKVRATMVPGDYAAVSAMTKDGWAKVDLSVGNTGLHLSGWIQGATLNLNGPCDDLPTIEP